MKKKSLLKYFWSFLLLSFLSFATLNGQTVDSTGVFPAIKAGSTETILHATVVFYDVNANGNFDAAYTLSAGPISAWPDYSASIAFYDEGFKVFDAGVFTNTNNITFEAGTTIEIWQDVDLTTKSYNTWIKTETMTYPALIHPDASFRRVDIDSICRWSAIHNASTEPDSVGAVVTDFVSTIPGLDVATLSEITFDIGTVAPEFTSTTTEYTMVVPYGTTEVIPTATPAVLGSVISGDGTVDVSSGSGTATIVVTSYDKSATETYTVNITVDNPLDDAILIGIESSIGAVDPIFHSDTLSYKLIVPVGTATVDLTATANYSGATIAGDGTITLSGGTATASIVVTSDDESTSETYTVNIEEADGKNYAIYLPGEDGNLSNIELPSIDLTTLPLTIEFWFKPEGTQNDYTGLLYNLSAGGLGFTGWQQRGGIYAEMGGQYNPADQFSIRTFTDNNAVVDSWNHVAVVLTDTSRTIILNGESKTEKFSVTEADFSQGTTYIGWRADEENRAFKGIIDEVRVWNVYKDSATIVDNKFTTYNGNETGLVGYWNFNIQHSSLAVELTDDNYHGSITGGTYVPSFDPSDASLSDIDVSVGALNPYFNSEITNYEIVVPTGTDTIFVTTTANNPLATVAGSDTVVMASGSANTSFLVTAFDGITKTTYNLTFTEYDGSLELKHSYTFEDGTAADVVGNADGTLNGGSIVNGVYSADENGEYIELPASEIAINTYPAISLELYITAGDGVNGANVMTSYFGNTTGDKGSNYYFTSHKSRTAISCLNTESPWSAETGISGTVLDDGEKHHLISTLTNDTIAWYVDGVKIESVALPADNKIRNLGTDFAYLCKSGYTGDATWMGSIYEYNIYLGIMDTAKIASNADAFLNATNDDATLSAISVNPGSLDPTFDPAVYTYTLSVPSSTATVNIIASPNDLNATVSGAGAIDVSAGSTTAKVVVTAQNGETKLTYTINIVVESGDGLLDNTYSNTTVYPTVSKGNFTVSFAGAPGKITVYSLTGQLVSQKTATSALETVEIATPGIYFIHVQSNNLNKMFKVTKVK